MQGVLHSLLRYFVEFDPAGGGYIHAQRLSQMPGNGFPFAVRVRCEIDFGSGFGFLADLGQNFAPAVDGDVFHFKIVLSIHAQLGFGHIPHMALAGFHFIAAAQKLGHGTGFRGRFHNNQFSCCHS